MTVSTLCVMYPTLSNKAVHLSCQRSQYFPASTAQLWGLLLYSCKTLHNAAAAAAHVASISKYDFQQSPFLLHSRQLSGRTSSVCSRPQAAATILQLQPLLFVIINQATNATSEWKLFSCLLCRWLWNILRASVCYWNTKGLLFHSIKLSIVVLYFHLHLII